MFKNFKIQVLLYLAIILLVLLAIGATIFFLDTMVYLLLLVPTLVYLIWQLFQRVDKTNTEIASFLANIKYNDYEAHFSESRALSDSYQNLHSAFNQVTEKFRDIRSEKEAQFQYLQAIVENVDTGLICFNEKGQTVLINKGLQQLLHKSYFPNFDAVLRYNGALYEALNSIVPGERKLVKLVVNNQLIQLAIRKTILRLKDDTLHLYALQNIHAELEEQEQASWQKLIRILTHEIMNSVTPVVSLAEMTNELIELPRPRPDDAEEDIRKSIEAIERRSKGLLRFTQTYRQLTKVPPPQFQSADLLQIFERVLTLLKPELERKKIEVQLHHKDIQYDAQLDPDLMEQVLINLLKNAMDALEETAKPSISIHIFKSLEGELEVQIADNGPGIPADILDQIFVPFFTTKKEGSGIGLSLCRQIIQLHKGSLFVYSTMGKGTVFTIKL